MRVKQLVAMLLATAILASAMFPGAALADEALGDADVPNAQTASSAESENAQGKDYLANAAAGNGGSVQVSKDGDAALVEGASFAVGDFSRSQKGSNRDIDGAYYGYSYVLGSEQGAYLQLIAADDFVVAYVPQAAALQLEINLDEAADQQLLKDYLVALDSAFSAGSKELSSYDTWYFTSETNYTVGAIRFVFDQLINGSVYASVIGVDGSDLTDSDNPNYMKPVFADFGKLTAPNEVTIVAAATGLDAAGEFLANLDWSPLWVSLRTTGIAIVIIFVLGLLAAYFCLSISQKAKNIADVIFTIPMVLPPTVCGFILLYACGSNTAFGQFWIDVGFPLIFSPAACVIAAVVVAFPLMYRNALGAFENLDPNMLDAARTLGWSNARIFLKLMLPLSWSSIAAGTVLAFARALGEFGATLFMAGNYVGITRTIPIAIYFEWMNGNDETAWFWTAVIIVFSFVVILFINLWSSHTTKYRRGAKDE